MNQLKKLPYLLLITLFFFGACKNDDSSMDDPFIVEDDIVIPPPPVSFLNGSITGTVIDKAGNALENVNIVSNNNTTSTDQNGVFTFKDIQLNEYGALVTAEKDGYYYNAKVIRPEKDKMTFTKIMLIEKELSGTVSATSGGKISTNGEASVDLPANGFKSEDGNAYTGNVNVYATWLDPTSEDLFLEMPGDLRAIDINDSQVQLMTYGMMGVELEGDGGEPLNLADGQTATIELPVPSELLANAPATIPLWHFDEAMGYWIEEGEATLEGDRYVGIVTHFSFWNCDVPSNFIDLSGTVVSEAGGVGGLLVEVSVSSTGASGYGYTNEDGFFSGYVPNDQPLTISVFDDCGVEIYSAEIGPFTEDTQLDNMVVNPSYDFVNFSGTLNCNGAAVSNGYMKVNFDNQASIIPVNSDGSFSANLSTCSATTVEVIGYDLDEFQQSVAVSYNIDGLTELDLGNVNVCEITFDEYFILSIDGYTYTVIDPAVTPFPDSTSSTFQELIINGPEVNGTTSNIVLVTEFLGLDVPSELIHLEGSMADGVQEHFIFSNGNEDLDVVFSVYENYSGGTVEGTIEGMALDALTLETVNISGEFKLTLD